MSQCQQASYASCLVLIALSFSLFLYSGFGFVQATPSYKYFSYYGDLVAMTISWYVEHNIASSEPVNLTCILNKGTNHQQVWSNISIGSGTCQFMPPDYSMTRNGTLLKTYVNTLHCSACNTTDRWDCGNVTELFYPISFEVEIPNEINSVVGERDKLGVTVVNKGMLTDQYNVTTKPRDGRILVTENYTKFTGSLSTNDVEKLYVEFILLTSELPSASAITITSGISASNPAFDKIYTSEDVSFRGSDKSLPDFGLFGIIQIMVVAAALISFLF